MIGGRPTKVEIHANSKWNFETAWFLLEFAGGAVDAAWPTCAR